MKLKRKFGIVTGNTKNNEVLYSFNTKFSIMKLTPLFFAGLFLVCVLPTKGIAQQKSSVIAYSLKDELYAVMDDSIENYSFFPTTKEQLLQMIATADSVYSLDTSTSEYRLILNNFRKFIGAIIKNKMTFTGVGPDPIDAVVEESLTRAKLDVCPLFPFCH